MSETTAVCTERWKCPLCGLQGQTWALHPEDTSLEVHMRWLHPERSR